MSKKNKSGGYDPIQMMMDLYNQMQEQNRGYTTQLYDLLGMETPTLKNRNVDNSLQPIDLSSYIDRLGAMSFNLGGTTAKYNDILSGYRGDLSQYQGLANQYAGGLLDSFLGTAGDIESLAGKSLSEAQGAYGKYLSGYESLARQDMPGLDVYRGQIGSQTTSNINRLKEMGGTTGGSIAELLSSQDEQLRELAVQSSLYKTQRRQQLADAQAQYGQLMSSAYGQNINQLSQAAGLRGAGYEGAAGIQSQLGMGSINAMSNIANQQANLEMNRANVQSGIIGQQAGLAQQQYYYNELMPWQTQIGVVQGLNQATMPYQTGMQFYGDLYSSMMQERMYMMNMIQNQKAQEKNAQSQSNSDVMSILASIFSGGSGVPGI